MVTRMPALPHRRALALAVALAMAASAQGQTVNTPSLPAVAPAAPATPVCPLGSFVCAPRPLSYALCRPNALLGFYEPGLPGDTAGRDAAVTDVRAQSVDSSKRTVYVLDGNVRLQRHDQLLRADHIRYNNDSTAYDARGNVRYQDSDQLLAASHITGTTTPDRSHAEDVRYQMLTSRGNGVAASVDLLDPTHSQYQAVTYSTCDPGHRVWEFRAKSIAINKQTGVGTAHSATMRLGKVPFFYLPYFTFPLDDRRKSGFLFPTFSLAGESGFHVAVPYYLNLAPNYDATLTPDIYTERGVLLGTEFRYLIGSSRGQLTYNIMPNDRRAGHDSTDISRNIDDGDTRYYVGFNDTTRLGKDWTFRTSIRRASDKYYFQDFRSDLYSATTNALHSRAYVSGSGDWWSASIGADSYQNVDPLLGDSNVEYKRWPRATFAMDLSLSRNIEFGMDSEAVAFRRDDSIEGNRLDLYPYIAASFGGAAWFLRPRLAFRYTGYQLVNHPQSHGYTDTTPSTAVPITSLDGGLIFERSAHWFGHSYTQTLEPRLYYLYVPYHNQSDQPIFDTRALTFDFWQLFSPNRFAGGDRQMDANNLTAAVTSRLLDDTGVERASLSFGQIHYFSPQRVQLYSRAATDYTGSAYVGQFALQFNDRWRLNTAYQWNPNDHHNDLATFSVQRRLGLTGVLNFSYRYRVNYMEQIDVSAVYPVSAHWRLLGRWNVSLRDRTHWQRGEPKTVEALAGIEYEGCCVALRVLARHYVRDYQGNTDNALMFEVVFKGLGSSSPQTGNFLQHAILGYQ